MPCGGVIVPCQLPVMSCAWRLPAKRIASTYTHSVFRFSFRPSSMNSPLEILGNGVISRFEVQGIEYYIAYSC